MGKIFIAAVALVFPAFCAGAQGNLAVSREDREHAAELLPRMAPKRTLTII